MTRSGPRSRNWATNSLFGAFFLALFGWGLLHAWGIHSHARISLHMMFAIPSAVLVAVTLYRYRQHWPVSNDNLFRSEMQEAVRLRRLRTVASYLSFFIAGMAIARLLYEGFFFSLLLTSIGLVCVPWTKISVCRNDFFLTTTLLGLGVATTLAFFGGSIHPLHHLLAGWLMLSVATTTILAVVLTHGSRLERMPATGYSATN